MFAQIKIFNPKNRLDPAFFLLKIFFKPQILSTQKFDPIQIFWGPKFLFTKIIFGTKDIF